ncbi:MAG: hypothetical protein RBR37_11990 [Advenella sp.]|nr:hypothetical protein [Advenella sp.]
MSKVYDRSLLEGALSEMESAAMNFAYRFINDGKIRLNYIHQTRMLAQEYRTKVVSGQMQAQQAVGHVQYIRNQILEAQRLHTSDIGRAVAVNAKKTGLTLDDLTEKYARQKFGTSFSSLSASNQNQVYLEIIDSSGRTRPSMNVIADRLSKLGRGLLVVTLGTAVYNIASAESKGKALAREGIILGSGFAGGAAGGAVAGLACGPAAPLCVTAGVFIGGALGALGADLSFGWLF